MTKDEWSTAWHEWLRGVSLVAFLGALAGLYFLKWLPQGVFPLVMGVAALVVVLGFVLEHCLCSLVKPVLRLLSIMLVLAGGAGLLAAIHLELMPGVPVAEGKLSPSHPLLQGYVPGPGDLVLDVRSTPGLYAKGDDQRIQVRALARYRMERSGPGGEHGPFELQEKVLKWAFTGSGEAKGKKGGSMGITSALDLLEGAMEGPFELRLESLEPAHARPLDVRVSQPQIPAVTLRLLLMGVALLALLLAPFFARSNAFPAFLPGVLVLTFGGVAALTGLPPDSPEPRLLGVLVASAFSGALVGYLLGKGIMRVFQTKDQAALEALVSGKGRRARGGNL